MKLILQKKQQLKLGKKQLALLVEHLGQYGAHAAAKRAGVRKGDILIAYDGNSSLTTESELFAHSLHHHKPGDKVSIVAIRGSQKREFTIPIQPQEISDFSTRHRFKDVTKIAVQSKRGFRYASAIN